MAKRKFKIICKHEKDVGGGRVRDCSEELTIEIEDSPTIDKEAATNLCRKLEQHFKEKHPNHNPYQQAYNGGCVVKQNNEWAVLQADGTIKNCKLNAGTGGYASKFCLECGRELRQFIDLTYESHICSLEEREKEKDKYGSENYASDSKFKSMRERFEPKPNNKLTQPNKFNWKSPWVIGTGLVLGLGIVGLVIYWFKKKNKL